MSQIFISLCKTYADTNLSQIFISLCKTQTQICPRYSFPCARHRHQFSNSFTKESGRDKWLKVRKWISILLLVPVLLITLRSPGPWFILRQNKRNLSHSLFSAAQSYEQFQIRHSGKQQCGRLLQTSSRALIHVYIHELLQRRRRWRRNRSSA